MQFKDIINNEKILKTLEGLGFQAPTPIQAEAIPQIMKGGDLRASAQTGTGKSAAFLLPALMKLSSTTARKGPRVLILAPTRELVIQLASESQKLGRSLGLVTVSLYGGVPYPKQNQELARRHDILIATPGRFLDHMNQRRIKLSEIEMFILDEADRMLDMGFIGPVKDIAEALPETRQTLMFTATFGKGIRKLSAELLRDPVEISTDTTQNRHENITQEFLQTDNLADKQNQLEKILSEAELTQAIVFSSTKMQARRISDDLRDQGIYSGSLHGDLNQRQRTKTIQQFRDGKIKILVATDVAGRGIDVSNVSHVINFDAPQSLDDYIHRIGRTGRAGNKGIAISFFSHKDRQIKREIERFAGKESAPDHSSHSEGSSKSSRKQRPFSGERRSFSRPRRDDSSSRPRREGSSFSDSRPKRESFPSSDQPFKPGRRESLLQGSDGASFKMHLGEGSTFSSERPRRESRNSGQGRPGFSSRRGPGSSDTGRGFKGNRPRFK
ncbi:DEAD/DEAH box helicase [Rhabdochlamydiaceae symbiont of Dictyostelium giganteum]|uniref:DEAD/DEAH box helicase n=1 Tax=Rhabdochlamydiaceae symbiont of Dictyostelium giganteum TaxID=3342349 RepID=UPI00384DB2B6